MRAKKLFACAVGAVLGLAGVAAFALVTQGPGIFIGWFIGHTAEGVEIRVRDFLKPRKPDGSIDTTGPERLAGGFDVVSEATPAADGENVVVTATVTGATQSSVFAVRLLFDIDRNGDGLVSGITEANELGDLATFDNDKVRFEFTPPGRRENESGPVRGHPPQESVLNAPPPSALAGALPVARVRGLVPLSARRLAVEVFNRELYAQRFSISNVLPR